MNTNKDRQSDKQAVNQSGPQKRKQRRNRLKKTVLCAMLSALGTVILFLGALLGDLDLTVCATASLIVLMSLVEMGSAAALAVYGATSALCLILFPAYFIVPMYICFAGAYPIVKYYAEKTRKIFAFIIKFAYLNGTLTLLLVLGAWLYGIQTDEAELFGLIPAKYAILALYLTANLTFLLFDYCLTKLTLLYSAVLSKRIGIYKLFR